MKFFILTKNNEAMVDYSAYKDDELLPLLREDSPLCDRAFYVLYHRYAAKVNAYCTFKVGTKQAAEDIFQETWLKFDKSVKNGLVISNVPAYLLTTSRNLCNDYYRQQNTNRESNTRSLEEMDFEEIASLSMQENFEREELLNLIRLAVEQLDDKYREAFVLKKFDELSYTVISKICGENVDCIKKRVGRAMIMVKNLLKPYINELSGD